MQAKFSLLTHSFHEKSKLFLDASAKQVQIKKLIY